MSVHHSMKPACLIVLALLSFLRAAPASEKSPAFLSAEGFGRFASGGRNGEMYHVTNLGDSGPGSFRDAVSQPRRIVVFDVSGIVRLESNLRVDSSITIAGQTAPGDGIMLYGRSVSFSGQTNIVVRYLRFREGISGDRGKGSVDISGGSGMIFDHCSIEWGRWDCLRLTEGSHDLTFQNCIIGEGVDPQRFGSLTDTVTNITYSHNLWINNQSRNPKAKGRIQYFNNIVYNWGVCGLVGGHSETDHFLDAVGNYFIAGPSSGPHFVGECKATDHIFQKDNFADLDRDGKLNGRAVVAGDFGKDDGAPSFMNSLRVVTPVGVTVESASAGFSNVVAHAGCSLHRDSVDLRLVDEANSLGTRGNLIHNEAEVGGPGELKEVHSPADLKALDAD